MEKTFTPITSGGADSLTDTKSLHDGVSPSSFSSTFFLFQRFVLLLVASVCHQHWIAWLQNHSSIIKKITMDPIWLMDGFLFFFCLSVHKYQVSSTTTHPLDSQASLKSKASSPKLDQKQPPFFNVIEYWSRKFTFESHVTNKGTWRRERERERGGPQRRMRNPPSRLPLEELLLPQDYYYYCYCYYYYYYYFCSAVQKLSITKSSKTAITSHDDNHWWCYRLVSLSLCLLQKQTKERFVVIILIMELIRFLQ